MKQLFIALVLINLGYPLLQRLLGVDSASAAAEKAREAEIVEQAPVSQSATPTFIAAPGYTADVDSKTETPADSQLPSAVEPEPAAATAVKLLADQAQPADDAKSASEALTGQCVIAGPFRKKAEAEALVSELAVSDIKSDLQPRDTMLLPDYMVYVGPESSEAKARELVATFAARNVDSHLIGRGDLKNALSLGVFSRGPLANSMRDKLRSEGHDANIATMSRNRKGFQVRTSLPQAMRARLVEKDTPLIDCPSNNVSAEAIASAKSVL